MRELLEQGVGVVIIGGVTAVGVLVRFLLFGYYGMLGRACKHFNETKNKTIVYIREDLKRRAEKGQEIRNVLLYTEYQLAERRICGFRSGTLEGVVTYSLLLSGLGSVLVAFACVLSGCGYRAMLEMLFLGGLSVAGFLVLDAVTGLREKDKRVRLGIRDYIENSLLECNEEVPQVQGQRADKPQKAGKRKNGKAQEEKRRLTEELLRERRQLEARSFAEQRRREKEEVPEEQTQSEATVSECAEEQVQAEAVVTECPEDGQVEGTEVPKGKAELSYEALLDEFLKEYPA